MFIHSAIDEQLDCFWVLDIVIKADMNIHMQTFMWTCFLFS